LVDHSEQPKVLIPMITLIVAIVLLPVCSAEWVWDDRYLFVNNPAMNDLSILLQADLFSPTGQGASNVYRPLTMITYWLTSLISDNAVWAHSINLFLHCCVVALSLQLMLALKARWQISAVLALWLGLHPGLVEAVAWVSGRQDLFPTLLFLLGWLFWLRAEQHKSGFILALTPFCKEPYLLIAAVILLWSLARREIQWTVLIWSLIGTVCYQMCRIVFGHTTPIAAIFNDPIGSFGAVLAHGGQLLLMPSPHPMPIFKEQFFMGFIGAIVCFSIVLYRHRTERQRILSHTWLGATLMLLPAGVAAQQSGLLGDRYLYHWIVVSLIVLAPVLSTIERAKHKTLFLGLTIAVLIMSMGITRPYAKTWHSDQTLFQWAWEKDKGNPFVAYQLGFQAHMTERNCSKAIPFYQQATTVDPRASNNLQACLLDSNQLDEAIALGEQLIAEGTLSGNPFANTARAYSRQNNQKRALELAKKAVQLDPKKTSYWVLLGNIHGQLQNLDDALKAFEQAIDLDPNHKAAQQGKELCLRLMKTNPEPTQE